MHHSENYSQKKYLFLSPFILLFLIFFSACTSASKPQAPQESAPEEVKHETTSPATQTTSMEDPSPLPGNVSVNSPRTTSNTPLAHEMPSRPTSFASTDAPAPNTPSTPATDTSREMAGDTPAPSNEGMTADHSSAGNPEVLDAQTSLGNTSRANPNLDNLRKKVIWFSPAFPTTQYIANHRSELDLLPIDGLVFDVLLNRSLSPLHQPIRFSPDNTLGRLLFAHSKDAAGSVVRLDPSDPNIRMAISDMLEEKKSGRHNFISVSIGREGGYYRNALLNLRPPAWNDDAGWAIATANCELIARIAKETGAKGLVLDFEPYPYGGVYDKDGNPLEDYVFNEHLYPESQSIARARGREIMQAMQRAFPDIVLIVPWGYSATLRNKSNWQGAGDHFNKMAVVMSYVKNFLDGMLESIPEGSSSKILDGYEFSYWYKTSSDFNEGLNEVLNLAPQNVASDIRSRYASFVAPAFAFWLDWIKRSDLPQWAPENRMNSAQQTEIMVGAGLRHSSQYSWVYAEEASLLNDLWWNNRYKPISNVDSSYLNALWKAKGTDFGVKGLVEGIDWKSGAPILRGWACRQGYPSPLNINIFFRDASGASPLSVANTFVADEPSEPELSDSCGSKGKRFRFSIPLASFSSSFARKEILVSPADSFGLGTKHLPSLGSIIQPSSTESAAGKSRMPIWSELRSLSDKPSNLLPNSGFETDGSWQATIMSPAGSASAQIISSDRYSGLRSAEIQLLRSDASAKWYQDFSVPGQKTFSLKLHYKTSVDFSASAEAWLVTEQNTYRLSLPPTHGRWREAELGNILTPSPGLRSVQLLFNASGGLGKVSFDSVELSADESGLTPASLVSDAGFEHGSSFWQTHSASGEYYFLIDKEVSKTGQYSARITTSSSGYGRWYQKGIPVVPGHRYHFSIAVKTSGPQDPFPFVGSVGAWIRCDEGALGACNRNYTVSPSLGEWKTISGDFIPTSDTVDIYLNSFGENLGGEVWFDDLSLTEEL